MPHLKNLWALFVWSSGIENFGTSGLREQILTGYRVKVRIGAGICSLGEQSFRLVKLLMDCKIVHNLILCIQCCPAHNRGKEAFSSDIAINNGRPRLRFVYLCF
jgi:hypothetical protein